MSTPNFARLAEEALSLWERPSSPITSTPDELARDRLAFWVRTLGSKTSFERRLRWSGLDVEAMFARLRPDTEALREEPWWHTLEALVSERTPEDIAIAAGDPLPYQKILAPIARRGARLLDRRLEGELAHVFGSSARASLHRALLLRLTQAAVSVLDAELRSIDLPLDPERPTQRFDALARRLAGDGLRALVEHYPVLGRAWARVTDHWLDANEELARRFLADRAAIEALTGPFPAITALEPHLSDPHRGGRSVAILVAESGRRIVYKPKPMDLEAVFSEILPRISCEAGLLELRGPKIILRDGYGWAEHIDAVACEDEPAAHRFYQRMGMFGAVLYVLGATDCHYQNLIASGEHPVLIDAETLLHPEALPFDPSLALGRDGDRTSVSRSGIFPQWLSGRPSDPPFDNSALGGANMGSRAYVYADVDTDRMHLVEIEKDPSPLANRPTLDGRTLDPGDFVDDVVAGFRAQYRALLDRKRTLLDEVFAELRRHQVRFVVRDTRVYGAIQTQSLRAELMTLGVDRSIALDVLARGMLASPERPAIWPILAEEVRALEALDVPLFTTRADDRGVDLPSGVRVERCFARSAWELLEANVEKLSLEDLESQTLLVRAAMFAWRSRPFDGAELAAPSVPRTAPVAREGDLVRHARGIGEWLRRHAVPIAGGGATWQGLVLMPEIARHRYDVVSGDLGSGTLGIALFLAALARVDGDARIERLAKDGVRATVRHIEEPHLFQNLARAGIGGASGVGSLVYGLARLGGLLEQPELFEHARHAATILTKEKAEEDRTLDVVTGSAGAVLGLLALHHATRDAAALERARWFGDHLVTSRVQTDSGHLAWRTIAPKPLTGFSHGAAGIAFALAKLGAATGDEKYLSAARDGVAYERALFSEEHGNWPDLRPDAPPFACGWCHGAPGIGLARLGTWSELHDRHAELEVEVALRAARACSLDGIDHLCCGNFGRLDLFVTAAETLGRPELLDEARRTASRVLARHEATGQFHFYPGLPGELSSPGLFLGVAGVGYQLLRLAAPHTLGSVLTWSPS